MKIAGITRRIDELGRIVIPKEIRKNLHMTAGELLEVFIGDSETIYLKKHNSLAKNEEFINCFIESLASKLNCNIYFSNLDKIVYSNDKRFIGLKLSDEISELIDKRTNIKDIKNIKITNSSPVLLSLKIQFISPNGDKVGALFFETDTIKDEDLIKFSKDFIEKYLEL